MGLLQNAIEEAQIATVSLSMAPYITLSTRVPRSLYIRFPFGNPFGEPGDDETQRIILTAALDWLYEAPEPNELFKLKIRWRRSRRKRKRSS